MSKKFAGVAAVVAGLLLVPVAAVALLTGPAPAPPITLSNAESASCSVPMPKAGVLDAAAVAAIAYNAGWRGQDINIAVAVARAESGWNAKATNENTNGSVDYGLFQINSIHAAILAGGNWANPEDNAAMAFKVWTDAGGKWGPWVTFWSGSYRKFLAEVAPKPVCVQPVVTACGKKVATGYANGQIPAGALCTLWANRQHRLRSDAAGGFDALAKAYAQRFGSKPCITDSYRSYAAQVDVRRRKPGLAAVPGTSNHGWGMALDLCGPGGGQWVPGSDYDIWMHQNGLRYGWEHPSWAHAGGSKPEPWHWECSKCGAK